MIVKWFERLETLAGLETRSAFWYVGSTFDEMEAEIVELKRRVSELERALVVMNESKQDAKVQLPPGPRKIEGPTGKIGPICAGGVGVPGTEPS